MTTMCKIICNFAKHYRKICEIINRKMDNLQLRTIRSIRGMYFYIPSYQRGYRWTPQQVTDLLDDIEDFIYKQSYNTEGFYCIQPLVVKEILSDSVKNDFLKAIQGLETVDGNIFEKTKELLRKYSKWEVIDGQQRLTTVYLILKYLEKKEPYSLEYQTRQNEEGKTSTKEFLDQIDSYKINSSDIYDTIDYHHFYMAYKSIIKWFEEKNIDSDRFKETLLDKVQFIWYRADDNEEPIKVFTRLNIGKISLTNAELIKAMFLNRSNFVGLSKEDLISKQTEIASQWDNIEYSLQNDELWLFINEKEYKRPTRIDFIFDIICHKDYLKIGNEKCGNDEWRTFRYFDQYFKSQKENNANKLDIVKSCWEKITEIFNIIQEWYNDVVFYHYIGFLIACGKSLEEHIDSWISSPNKKKFLENRIKSQIKDITKGCYNPQKGLENTIYESEDGSKTKCRALLLLHNIQTVMAQNNALTHRSDYQQGVFYKFPFHLYKKEKWDIEHIDSNTENPLDNSRDQKEWLRFAIIGKQFDESLKKDIDSFLKKDNKENLDFAKLREQVIKETIAGQNEENTEFDKNKIWNYVLLDSGTNRGYGNAIFPAKRRVIIGKDRGIKYSIDNDGNLHPTPEEERTLSNLLEAESLTDEQSNLLKELANKYSAVSFIPPCTRNVFMKYYTKEPNNLVAWGINDAKAYLEDIKILLNDFID